MSARKIGPLKISVDYDHTDECYVGHVEADERTEACDERDAAEAAAEAKLRDMLADLQAHFAPVLQWTVDEATLLGCWRLSVGKQTDGLYWWTAMLDGNIGPDGGDCESVDEARRAAEAALRSLGVVFRVEDAR